MCHRIQLYKEIIGELKNDLIERQYVGHRVSKHLVGVGGEGMAVTEDEKLQKGRGELSWSGSMARTEM